MKFQSDEKILLEKKTTPFSKTALIFPGGGIGPATGRVNVYLTNKRIFAETPIVHHVLFDLPLKDIKNINIQNHLFSSYLMIDSKKLIQKFPNKSHEKVPGFIKSVFLKPTHSVGIRLGKDAQTWVKKIKELTKL